MFEAWPVSHLVLKGVHILKRSTHSWLTVSVSTLSDHHMDSEQDFSHEPRYFGINTRHTSEHNRTIHYELLQGCIVCIL